MAPVQVLYMYSSCTCIFCTVRPPAFPAHRQQQRLKQRSQIGRSWGRLLVQLQDMLLQCYGSRMPHMGCAGVPAAGSGQVSV
jgi:hypothetical protein